jgi:DNA replication and repair protein RecF
VSGLALTRLTLSHFRSHKSARLTPGARPLALFGPNGAGKTNILEAVSLISPGRGIRRAAPEDLARTPENLGWKIAASLDSLGHSHAVETWAESGTSRQVRIDDKPAPQAALGRILRMVWLVPSMDRLWLEGAEGRRRFLDRITLSFFPDHAEVSLGYDKAMRERNRLLKDNVTDAAWFHALEARMAEAGIAIAANRAAALDRIAAAQDGAATAFPTADLSILPPDDAPTPETEQDLLRALADGRRRDMAAGRTLIGPHRVDLGAIYAAKGAPARQCSTGEQKALLVSLILANARALADEVGAAPVILLDEVAAHLDESRRAALYDEICALGAQAWMTGTERALFSALGDRADYYEVTEIAGQSRIEWQEAT